MAKKKTAKITKAPSGVSFMYAPHAPAGPLHHSWPRVKRSCKGIISVTGPNTSRQANRPDAVEYGCDCCDWTSPSGNFSHEPSVMQPHHVVTDVVKKQAQKKNPRWLRDAVRKEHARRMRILTRERAKFPPSLIKVKERAKHGKNKGKLITIWHDNPDFTDAMREHMHRFYVDAIEIRDALKDGKPLPEYPLPA